MFAWMKKRRWRWFMLFVAILLIFISGWYLFLGVVHLRLKYSPQFAYKTLIHDMLFNETALYFCMQNVSIVYNLLANDLEKWDHVPANAIWPAARVLATVRTAESVQFSRQLYLNPSRDKSIIGLYALVRSGEPVEKEMVSHLTRLLEPDADEVTRVAAYALVAIKSPEAIKAIERWFTSRMEINLRNPLMDKVILDLAEEHTNTATLNLLAKAISYPAFSESPRSLALLFLNGSYLGVSPAIERLNLTLSRYERRAITRKLTELSGRNYGTDTVSWRKWWNEEGKYKYAPKEREE